MANENPMARATLLGTAAGLLMAVLILTMTASPPEPTAASVKVLDSTAAASHSKVKVVAWATALANHHIKALEEKKKEMNHAQKRLAKKLEHTAPTSRKVAPNAEAHLTFAQLESKAKHALANGNPVKAEEAAQAMRVKAAADSKISSKTAEAATRDSLESDKIEKAAKKIESEEARRARQKDEAAHYERERAKYQRELDAGAPKSAARHSSSGDSLRDELQAWLNNAKSGQQK